MQALLSVLGKDSKSNNYASPLTCALCHQWEVASPCHFGCYLRSHKPRKHTPVTGHWSRELKRTSAPSQDSSNTISHQPVVFLSITLLRKIPLCMVRNHLLAQIYFLKLISIPPQASFVLYTKELFFLPEFILLMYSQATFIISQLSSS